MSFYLFSFLLGVVEESLLTYLVGLLVRGEVDRGMVDKKDAVIDCYDHDSVTEGRANDAAF